MNEENKIGYYAIIPATILFNENLKANEKLLYAVITILANKEGYCFASNSYLAKMFNAKPHTISNWISNLNKMNFVCVEIIRNDKNEIVQRRIYPNDVPYTIKMTYPYTIEMTEGMSQKRQYNNNRYNKIDIFFNYIIKKEGQNIEHFTNAEELEFWKVLEKVDFNYTKEVVEIFSKDNLEKIKIIIYALKELYKSSRKQLLDRVTREKLLSVYDNCKDKQIEYQETEKQINNFFEYYYTSLIKSLEKI